ncbi:MAG: hypothetical protein HYZ29_16995 [Myxococcales bacterium]|nr:hypothetical protein [Myxococcales bacterium]
MRKKHKPQVDLRAEVEASRELEEIRTWVETPTLVSVEFVIRCGPGVDGCTRLEACYGLSTPSTHVVVRSRTESIRDALIAWAVTDEDGAALIAGLARTVGVDPDDVEAEMLRRSAELTRVCS